VIRPNSDTDFDTIIPRAYWRLKLQTGGANTTTAALGSRAQVIFHSGYFSFTAGTPLQFVGQKRPTTYSAGTATLDFHMESFLRERALYYGTRFLVARGQQASQITMQEARIKSEQFLSYHPQEFRVAPNSTRVLGR
jgi:hypothetical protein